MTEIWKPIPGYEGFYEVSTLGRIRSLDRQLISTTGKHYIKSGRIRKLTPNKNTGYLYVVLAGETTKKTVTVHRLVASAFIENPKHYECVNHKNEDKHDNRPENLEWCTKAYNNSYGSRKTASCKAVIGTNIKTKEKLIFPSARIAERETGANYKNISACCRGLRPRAAGYEWRFMYG